MVALLGVMAGLAVVGIGALIVRHAYAVTKIEEQIDAIGSKRTGEIEPADWHVLLTKVFGAMVAGGGVVIVYLAFLE